MKDSTTIAEKLPMLPDDRERWIHDESLRIGHAFSVKYRKGAIEHKSDLGDASLIRILNEMEQEALDQLAYVAELKRRVFAANLTEYQNAKPSA